MKEEALKLADELYEASKLESDLNRPENEADFQKASAMIRRLVEELDKQSEPVAWMLTLPDGTHDWILDGNGCEGYIPLYTAPPKRWVGLTGLEQKELMAMNSRYAVFETEAKLKEKNT